MERLSSAVRLDLRPGEWVLWKARPFRFISLQGSTASIRDSVNAELHEVAVAELRGMPSLPPEDVDQRCGSATNHLRPELVPGAAT